MIPRTLRSEIARLVRRGEIETHLAAIFAATSSSNIAELIEIKAIARLDGLYPHVIRRFFASAKHACHQRA